MNREDIKYVRKIDVSRKPSVYQDWVVQTSSDNVNWYNLVVDVDEWLVDLIVDALKLVIVLRVTECIGSNYER
jgi:hypothetical protein